MSELREKAVRLKYALTNRDTEWQCCLNEETGSINIIMEHLEAFAKAEQIRGMEQCKDIIKHHHSRVWITEQIDAEITKLKEGKP